MTVTETPVEVKTEDVSRRTREFVEELRRNNIVALPYRKPPVTKELFILSVDASNAIRLWAGLAHLEIFGDPERRQVVLVATERDRTITRTYRINVDRPYVDASAGAQRRDPTETEIAREARSRFPLQVPKGTWGELKCRQLAGKVSDHTTRIQYSVTQTVKAPDTEQAFLIGMDETSQFVSALPSVVHSVAEAHALLRPAGVPETALRQGEWYFVPATPAEQKLIDSYFQNTARSPHRFSNFGLRALERGSTHRAILISVSGARETTHYATGKVWDTRPGRHAPLDLGSGWFRVVRNQEVPAAEPTVGNVERQSGRGRSSSRWD